MPEPKYNWNYNEFLSYLLLYAAHSDLKLKDEEKELILAKTGQSKYKDLKKVFEKESDYDRLQTIISFKGKFYNSLDDKEQLYKHLKELLLSDEEYNTLERSYFMILKKILG